MSATRRTLLAAPLILPARSLFAAGAPDLAPDLAAIESRLGGRLGVAAGSAERVLLDHRAEERFPFCSTFKVLAVAAILARVDAGSEDLDRTIRYGADDLLSYAPVTRKALETAANLLLVPLGGPAGLTAWLRGIGDPVTRLDRTEPTLNEAIPGDPRDTTTPEAMRATLGRILLGSVLSPSARARLEGWMVASQTGFKRLRAGLPTDWPVGDKTGSGDNGSFNDVAILRPPGRAPVIAAVYMTGMTAPAAVWESAYAEIGRLIAARAAAA